MSDNAKTIAETTAEKLRHQFEVEVSGLDDHDRLMVLEAVAESFVKMLVEADPDSKILEDFELEQLS